MNLRNLPMPPSSNAMYRLGSLHNGKFGKFKSQDMRVWGCHMNAWAFQNAKPLNEMRKILSTALTPSDVLAIDCTFWFPEHRILTKNGKPKKLDASNRIKPLHDALAELLGTDDCWFWEGRFEKRIHPEGLSVADVELRIVPMLR